MLLWVIVYVFNRRVEALKHLPPCTTKRNSEGESDSEENFVLALYRSLESSESENNADETPLLPVISTKHDLDTTLQYHFHNIETVFCIDNNTVVIHTIILIKER